MRDYISTTQDSITIKFANDLYILLLEYINIIEEVREKWVLLLKTRLEYYYSKDYLLHHYIDVRDSRYDFLAMLGIITWEEHKEYLKEHQ